MKGLQALSPELKSMIKEGATLDTVMTVLADNFGGAAAASAETAAGKFKILKNSLAETQESIGAALLPALQKVLPVLQKFADWAQNNPKVFLYVAGTIAAVTTSILALNFAMALNPVVALVAGIIALGAAMVYLEQRTNALTNAWSRFGSVIRLLLGPLYDVFVLAEKVGLIDKISLPSFTPSTYPAAQSTLPPAIRFAPKPVITPVMPTIAPIITTPTGGGGGGGGSQSTAQAVAAATSGIGGAQVGALTTFGMAERIAAREAAPPVVINVTGGVSTSAEIGQSVYNALLQYKQVYGPLTAIAE
jgi:hypothetical protein